MTKQEIIHHLLTCEIEDDKALDAIYEIVSAHRTENDSEDEEGHMVLTSRGTLVSHRFFLNCHGAHGHHQILQVRAR